MGEVFNKRHKLPNGCKGSLHALFELGLYRLILYERGGIGTQKLPVYVLMVIPDHKLESYSLSAGSSLINKLGSTKITGFDYNLIEKGITGPELSALLKYNLDLRIAGNRAPLLFGAHAANYPNEDHEYSKALSDFLAYATSKPAVRIVPFIDIVRWMENPQGFALNSKPSYRMDISIVPEIIPPDNPCQAEDWNSSKAYTGGDQVVYDGKLWLANWWTQGNAPNTSTAWQYLNDCIKDDWISQFQG